MVKEFITMQIRINILVTGLVTSINLKLLFLDLMDKDFTFLKMVKDMRDSCLKERNLEKVVTFMSMVINIKANGLMIERMDMVSIIIVVQEKNTKVIGKMVTSMGKAPIVTLSGMFTPEHGWQAKKVVKAF